MKITYYVDRYLNRRLNKREFKERKSVLRSYPSIAYIDPSNICPLSCPLCPTGNRSSTQSKGLMSFQTFKKIYDQIGQYLYEVHLYNWGEPLLNRNIIEMIDYAKKKYKPDIIISSNLSGLSEEWAEKIVHSQADLLNVSIDGVTQKTYEQYRVGGNLEQVLKTLTYMVNIQRTSGQKTPLIRWQFIPMKHNEHEIEEAEKTARNIGVDFRIHRVRLNICDFDKKGAPSLTEKQHDLAPKNVKYIRLEKKLGPENPCKFLWDRVVFNWDGSVLPCCKIYTANDTFADNVDSGFKNIWNGPAYRTAREIFKDNRAHDNFICQRCVDHEGSF